MKNISIVSTDGNLSGGIFNFCETIRNSIEIKSYILIGSKEKETKFFFDLELKKFFRAPLIFFNIFDYYKHLYQNKINVLFLNDPQCSTITYSSILYSLIFKTKVIFISHGFLFHNNQDSVIKKLYFKFLCKITFKFIRVISVSENDNLILKKYKFDNFLFIPHGIQTKNLNLGNNYYKALLVGRDVPHKNINIYYELVKKIDYRCGLISSNLRNKNHHRKLDIFENISKDDYYSLLNKSKYIVSFSSYEGFGLAVLEAVGAGSIPIIYSNTSFKNIFKSIPEILFHDLSADSALERISAIEAMTEEDLKELKYKLNKINERYSTKNMISKYQKEINQI